MQILHRVSALSKVCHMVAHPGLTLTVQHQPIDRIQLFFQLRTSDGLKPHMEKKEKGLKNEVRTQQSNLLLQGFVSHIQAKGSLDIGSLLLRGRLSFGLSTACQGSSNTDRVSKAKLCFRVNLVHQELQESPAQRLQEQGW